MPKRHIVYALTLEMFVLNNPTLLLVYLFTNMRFLKYQWKMPVHEGQTQSNTSDVWSHHINTTKIKTQQVSCDRSNRFLSDHSEHTFPNTKTRTMNSVKVSFFISSGAHVWETAEELFKEEIKPVNGSRSFGEITLCRVHLKALTCEDTDVIFKSSQQVMLVRLEEIQLRRPASVGWSPGDSRQQLVESISNRLWMWGNFGQLHLSEPYSWPHELSLDLKPHKQQ